MSTRRFALLLAVLIISMVGCVQTRRVESSSVMSCTAGGCGASAETSSTYAERRWTGFGGPGRLAQP